MVKEKTEVAVEAPLEEITIWSNPITTVSTLMLCSVEWIQQGWTIARKNLIAIIVVLAVVLVPHAVHGPHSPVRWHNQIVKQIDDIAKFAGWWVGLGILSSIGLGSND